MMKAPITLSAFAESLVRASRRKLWLTVLLTIVLAGGAVLGARLGERRPQRGMPPYGAGGVPKPLRKRRQQHKQR
jgi:hypothetical protein